MIYIFRITANLMDSTVMITKSKELAEKVLTQDTLRKNEIKDVRKMDCATYEELTGNIKGFPAPYEIVEYGIVKRYKIKRG